jgi:hypothetical protein
MVYLGAANRGVLFMSQRHALGLFAQFTVILMALAASGAAQAFDQTKYPDWHGQWRRAEGGVVNYDPTKPRLGQNPPLTAEYQAIYEANLKDQDEGGQGIDPTYVCLSPGMPRIMNMYEPMEIVITPETTHILTQHIHDARRIFTDGRSFPTEIDPTFAGYSIGEWVDTDGDGRHDELRIETRFLRNPRTYDATGIPFHEDGETVIKERIFGDKANPNKIYDEITSYDHALTRPWTVTKTYIRDPDPRPLWRETVCSEANPHLEIAGQGYMLSADGLLMPTKKNQPPPDLRYFRQLQK